MGHHTVPQEYLRGFATQRGSNSIYQFDKQAKSHSGDGKSLPIRIIAQQSGYYTDEDEVALNSEVEMPANVILRKLRDFDFELNQEERRVLAKYIATMLRRVPKGRALVASLAPRVIDETYRALRQEHAIEVSLGRFGESASRMYLTELAEREAEDRANPERTLKQWIDRPWPREAMTKVIQEMHWRFVVTDGPLLFLTSDSPVFIFDGIRLGGVETEAEFTFPISTRIGLFGSWTPLTNPHCLVQQEKHLVMESNRRQAIGATRFVFCATKREPISRFAYKSESQLRLLPWQDIDAMWLRKRTSPVLT